MSVDAWPAKRRIWRYRYGDWSPAWWRYLIPYIGGDEWGRRTVVIHTPPIGFLVIAYWTCRCSDCDDIRAQTATWIATEGDTVTDDTPLADITDDDIDTAVTAVLDTERDDEALRAARFGSSI